MSDVPPDEELTPRQQVEATVWRILRAYTVGVVAPGVDPNDTETAAAVCDPHDERIVQTTNMLMLAFDHGIGAHLSTVHRELHNRSGMDPLDIDKAVAAASWPDGVEP